MRKRERLAAMGLEQVRAAMAGGVGVRDNVDDERQTTLLMHAGSPEAVRFLVGQGAEMDDRDADGRTALMHCGDVETARALLDAGADVNAVNDDGNSVLDVCIRAMVDDMFGPPGELADYFRSLGALPGAELRAGRTAS